MLLVAFFVVIVLCYYCWQLSYMWMMVLVERYVGLVRWIVMLWLMTC